MVVAELVTSMDNVRFQNRTLSQGSDSILKSKRTWQLTYICTPGPLPLFRTPEFPPPDPILTKPVGIVPTDPARPGAPDHTEDLAGGDSGLNLSRVKAETVVKADVYSQFRSDSFPNAQWKTRSFP